ncbi:DUF7508 domain-containing protein [Halosegnis longus]|uniref:DUF7508 domain-containing protein n=1 Tax=Halosegnis longus TaxID=2216012 RepID=A0AAJ4R931_9EURY|nr:MULTISPECIES: hypothetical protein [Halobacteriales]RNJ26402.1 hypothetical protein Nmn1133_06795 [Salella cibi]
MPLPTAWSDLTRATIGSAPDRYGVIEFGTDGEIEAIEAGMIRDVLKEALTYGDHEQVRWKAAEHREHAERLASEHRDRLSP